MSQNLLDAVSTPPELAARYSIPVSTITNAAQAGKFNCRKAGEGRTAVWLIEIASFEAWLPTRPAPGRGRKKATEDKAD